MFVLFTSAGSNLWISLAKDQIHPQQEAKIMATKNKGLCYNVRLRP
jgi:hypothetical protein